MLASSAILLIFLFQSPTDAVGMQQLFLYGPTVIILVLILGFLIRMAPMWKEIRLKDMELRVEENVVKREQAQALTALAEVLKDIGVEQRRATDTIQILQRVNADASDRLSHNVASLTERLDRLETSQPFASAQLTRQLTERVESLEKYVGPEAATART